MLLKITHVKTYTFDAEEKQDSEKKSNLIVNNFIYIIKSVWNYVIKRVLNYQLINNCRKQIKFNLRDWWIMHLHHIGLPPATNRYLNLSVSGNPLINTELK